MHIGGRPGLTSTPSVTASILITQFVVCRGPFSSLFVPFHVILPHLLTGTFFFSYCTVELITSSTHFSLPHGFFKKASFEDVLLFRHKLLFQKKIIKEV